jgi:hypothetical protein
MSLLNLNSPQERNPRGKKSSRVWMGFGLIIAVLGLGSTFAANININSNRDSEFGQGLTQTVYCGENDEGESITVTPISAFVNSVATETLEATEWRQPIFDEKRFVRVSSLSLAFEKEIRNDETGDLEVTKGYYVTSRNDDGDDRFYVGFGRPAAGSIYDTFVPQVLSGTRYGFYKYVNFVPGALVDTLPSTFELGGITITDIPTSCVGRDFIISAYGSTGSDPLELSSALEVTEIAVNWDPLDLEPDYSFNRRIPGIPISNDGKIVIEQAGTENSLKIIFSSTAGRLLTDAFAKIVVETQENIVGDANIETLAD